MAIRNLRAILIGPNVEQRQTVLKELLERQVAVVAELSAYSAVRQAKPESLDWDLALLELDSDPDLCLAIAHNLSVQSPASTVMVYSQEDDAELLMKCMWAGAREFLTLPISPRVLNEALARAKARRAEAGSGGSTGKILLFLGSKGGSGVTTIASNFALSLQQEAAAPTLLLELQMDLGETALLLGLDARLTLADVIENANRLDHELLAGMISRHESGLGVIPGPDHYSGPLHLGNGELAKLLQLAREDFHYIVVDTGAGLGHNADHLLEQADEIYLISQADVPSLRNAQRFIKYMQRLGASKVRLVLNRYDSRRSEIDDEHIAKAVGVPVDWKIPNDYMLVRRSHNTAEPLAGRDSPIARTLRQMAREACGRAVNGEPKKGLWLFR